ncbi:MAG: site-specific integrase [Clostridia bacterium]|nr:site-specific integrase [Clostridia bacterium]
MAKRANGEGSIRKRANGSWEGRYSVEGVQHSVYGRSQGTVKSKLREALSDIDNGEYLDETNMTYADWLKIWREDWLDDVATSTANKYRADSLNHIEPVIGKKLLKELTASDLKRVLKEAKAKGLAEKTVINIRIAMHKSLDAAIEDKKIKRNPCTKQIKVPDYEEPPKEMRPLKDNEVPLFLKTIAGHKYEDVYYFDLFTGVRESELIGLTWDCIDFDEVTIHLYRQYVRPRKTGKKYRFTKLKTKKARTFTPSKSVMDLLLRIRRRQAQHKLLAGTSWNNPEGFVFTNELGRPLTIYVVYDQFKKIAAQIGIPELRFHDLRHTYATLALQTGVDPKTVSKNLGHYSVAFTLDKYAHVSNTMMKNSADRMEAYIRAL